MRKHILTLILFSLASFYFLTTDVILNDETASLFGHEKVITVYSAAMLSLGAGFILFSMIHKKTSTVSSRKSALFILFLTSILTLLGFILTNDPIIFILLSIIHMLSTGIIGGAVHYYAAMALCEKTYSGRVIGLAIGTEALMQVILLIVIPSSMPRALVLIGVLCIVFYLVLKKTPSALTIQQQPKTASVNAPSKKYLYSVVAIIAVISLMGGYNDGIITAMHVQQTVNIYAYPRLFYLVGIVTAGFIADLHSRRYLPVAMLSIMMCSSVGVMFLNSPITYAINASIFFLFAGFAILYFTVTFFDIAPSVENPMLWAGMGRTVRFLFIAIGALFSEALFTTLSINFIIAVYIILSVILLVLFYISGSLTMEAPRASASESPKTEMVDKAKCFALTKREIDVLIYLLDNLQTREIAEFLCITEHTVKFHISNIFDKTGAKNRLDLFIILSKNDEPYYHAQKRGFSKRV